MVEEYHNHLTYGGHYVDQFKAPSHVPLPSVLKELVTQWHRLTRMHNITYWLHAGSLLGSHCRNGVLPGDDDVDVGMLASDFTRLVALMPSPGASDGRYRLIVRAGLHSDIIGAKFTDTKNGRFCDIALYYNDNPLVPLRKPRLLYNGAFVETRLLVFVL